MSNAAPSAPLRGFARMLPDVRKIAELMLTAFLGALLAGACTYYLTQKLNKETAVQQQHLASVQDFAATGARVDAAISTLADAAIDEDGVNQAKKEARQAIAAHAASALALRPVIGRGNVEAYMAGVAELRVLVDAAGDVPAAARASKGRYALIDNRNRVVEEARRRIF